MRPISIYLDQNIFNIMLDENSGDWHSNPFAGCLLNKEQFPLAEVWIGPEHVIETALASDPTRRRSLAEIQLELCDSRRMSSGYDYDLVHDLGMFVNSFSISGFDKRAFTIVEDRIQQNWLGTLALIAASPHFKPGPAIYRIHRTKLENSLRLQILIRNPATMLKMIDEVMAGGEPADTLGLGRIHKLSSIDLEHELGSAVGFTSKADRRTMLHLEKRREEIACFFCAQDIKKAIASVFQAPFDLAYSFDFLSIMNSWPNLQRLTHCQLLPKALGQNCLHELFSCEHHLRSLLHSVIDAAMHAGLALCPTGYQSTLREIETSIRKKEMPTTGVTLDLNHATAAIRSDIFVSKDTRLASSVRALANRRGSSHRTIVVCTARQLAKALAEMHEAGGVS